MQSLDFVNQAALDLRMKARAYLRHAQDRISPNGGHVLTQRTAAQVTARILILNMHLHSSYSVYMLQVVYIATSMQFKTLGETCVLSEAFRYCITCYESFWYRKTGNH